MNHRDEHLHVLSMSLIKDRGVTLNDALKAEERFLLLPPEAFPQYSADTFKQFYGWLLGHEDPPEWIKETLQNVLAETRVNFAGVRYQGASPAWWKRATVVMQAELTQELSDNAKSLIAGGPTSSKRYPLSTREWEDLAEWVGRIRGEWEHEEPFELKAKFFEPREERG